MLPILSQDPIWPPLGRLCYDGSHIQVFERSISLDSGHAFTQESASIREIVRVYPVVSRSTLVMIEEYRHEVQDVLLRVVSGTIEPDEAPVDAAARELSEELGFRAGDLKLLGVTVPMLKVRHRIHHFLAFEPAPGPQCLEPTERIRPFPVELDALESLAFSGKVFEDSVIIGLLMVARALARRPG